jgi:hypothetical protein
MPPDQKAFQIWSIWLLIAPVIMDCDCSAARSRHVPGAMRPAPAAASRTDSTKSYGEASS